MRTLEETEVGEGVLWSGDDIGQVVVHELLEVVATQRLAQRLRARSVGVCLCVAAALVQGGLRALLELLKSAE